tara:strand:- start:4244 stop:4528 length:285 start_codon:yes stop_codon:yes gene_type:complete
MEKTHIEGVLTTIGIETSLLNSKNVFTREETERIFNCSPETLKKFEKREWIKPNWFKNKKFYTRVDILNCIKIQAPFKITDDKKNESATIWDKC